jgi:hypothetical protein
MRVLTSYSGEGQTYAAVSMCPLFSHLRTAAETNSGPLSERKYFGFP